MDLLRAEDEPEDEDEDGEEDAEGDEGFDEGREEAAEAVALRPPVGLWGNRRAVVGFMKWWLRRLVHSCV